MSEEPQITVSILSWLLEDRLIKTLKGIPLSTSIPLALCLHVQGEEQIPREKKREIYEAASGFIYKYIYFTPYNNGVAGPRANLLKRSSKTPYIFMTDNDMDFKEGSIDALYNFLSSDENAEYGAVNLVDNTLIWHRRVDDAHKRVTYFPVSLYPPKVVDIDLCGACSTLMRSEIANVPDIIDRCYYLGTWDVDLCMNIKKLGFKLATLCDERYLAYNDSSYRTEKYLSIKGLIPSRLNGIRRFRIKWKIESEINRDEALKVQIDPTDTAIITRSIYNSLGDKPGVGILTEYRLKAMQNFFINCLKNQIDKDFIIYIFVNDKENETTKAIKALNWGDLNVNFIYIKSSLARWQENVEKSGNWGRENDPGCPEDLIRQVGHPKHTIMARLDNDDWVAPGWIVHIKYMARTVDKTRFLINYQITGQAPDGRLYRFHMKHKPGHISPFFAIIQRDHPKISPYEDIHLKMGRFFETIITIQPSYVFMVVGEDNRSNRIYRFDRFFEDIKEDPKKLVIAKPKVKKEKIITSVVKIKSKNDWKSRIRSYEDRLIIEQTGN